MVNDMTLPENTVYSSIRTVLVTARQKAYTAVNTAMVEAYWEIGRQIEQAVGNRAEYGKGLLQYISRELSAEFGKGFTVRNLQTMRQFFNAFPNTHTLCAQLSWSHYRLLIRIEDASRREFYLTECAESNWSVRQLERQINSLLKQFGDFFLQKVSDCFSVRKDKTHIFFGEAQTHIIAGLYGKMCNYCTKR